MPTLIQKLHRRHNSDDKKSSFATACTVPNQERKEMETIMVSDRWDRLYYGLRKDKPVKKQQRKEKTNKLFHISRNKQELYRLKKTNESLMRDHHHKDNDYARLETKMAHLKAWCRAKEKAWEKERTQLLYELEMLREIAAM